MNHLFQIAISFEFGISSVCTWREERIITQFERVYLAELVANGTGDAESSDAHSIFRVTTDCARTRGRRRNSPTGTAEIRNQSTLNIHLYNMNASVAAAQVPPRAILGLAKSTIIAAHVYFDLASVWRYPHKPWCLTFAKTLIS